VQQPLRLQRGDVLRLRRPHPCGSTDFEVVRLGADIGLHCTQCGRRIMLARSLLERRLERFVSRAPEYETPADIDIDGLDAPGTGDSPPAAEPATAAESTAPPAPRE
jgi:hypothetical protein